MVAFLQHLQGLPDIPGDLALARCNISPAKPKIIRGDEEGCEPAAVPGSD